MVSIKCQFFILDYIFYDDIRPYTGLCVKIKIKIKIYSELVCNLAAGILKR